MPGLREIVSLFLSIRKFVRRKQAIKNTADDTQQMLMQLATATACICMHVLEGQDQDASCGIRACHKQKVPHAG